MPGLYNPGIIISNGAIRLIRVINFISNVSCRAMSSAKDVAPTVKGVAIK